MEKYEDGFLFTDDRTKISLDGVCRLLAHSHWAHSRPRETIARTMESSYCFAAFDGPLQIGFARVISDGAVYSLLMDVIIDPDYRSRGVGKSLLTFLDSHPALAQTSKALWTTYAKDWYAQCGFHEESQLTLMFRRP